MNVVIIKYNAGNIQSVLFALERLGIPAIVTDDPELIIKSDKVIFPGVGEASSAMAYLKGNRLDKVITGLTQPVLGICLGMQLMCSYSEENNTDCLGIFDKVVVRKFNSTNGGQKIPQIGWNTIFDLKSPLFKDVQEKSYCYYVHSYYASLSPFTVATTDYIVPYAASIQNRNFFGVQFHPEKSAGTGEQILMNFLNL